jgi:DNA-binding transcriptional MerR regulator
LRCRVGRLRVYICRRICFHLNLRYYDREGLFPNVKRSNRGIRVNITAVVDKLTVIACLKFKGMEIKDIKQFVEKNRG